MDNDSSSWQVENDGSNLEEENLYQNDEESNWEENGEESNSWESDSDNYHDEGFEQPLFCYPIDNSMQKYSHLEKGNRILLPASLLDRLGNMDKVTYPIMFQLKNPNSEPDQVKVTHCGVMEFTSDEGMVFMPNWMMNNMGFEPGDIALIKNVDLAKGEHIKLQPHTKEFTELSNPKAVLEHSLKGYSCLSPGDTIMAMSHGKEFKLEVMETKPDPSGVCIVDTDCEVDFAPPLETEKAKLVAEAADDETEFRPFSGVAYRLDGTSTTSAAAVNVVGDGRKSAVFSNTTSIADVGKLSEKFKKVGVSGDEARTEEKGEQSFKAFTGKSYRLSD